MLFRSSIAVAFVAVGVGLAFGVPLGLAAASMRGSLLDEIIMLADSLLVTVIATLPANTSRLRQMAYR